MAYRSTLLKILTLFLLALALSAPGWLVTPALAADADDILALVNQERTSRSLAPLVLCQRLTVAAQRHSDDMVARQFFDHTNPSGQDPFERMVAIGYNYTWAGENIAVGQPTAADVMNAWMNSTGHRANILSTHYTHLGVGTAVGDYKASNGQIYHNMKYWTQTFGAGGQCTPQPPSLIAPLGSLSNPQPVFSWSPTGGATSYELQIGITNPPTTPSVTVTTASYTPAPMLPGTYYWRVRANSAPGVPFTNWSTVGSFVLGSPPDAAPPRAYFTTQPFRLTWMPVSWATSYELEVYSLSTLAVDSRVFSASTSSLTANVSGLAGGTYYWRVRALSSTATGAWSVTDTFALKP